jgi:hypothetical protein
VIENRYFKSGLFNLLSIIGAITHWLSYTQTEYANGWDAYFYLVQINSLIETGSMHSQEWSLIYPFVLLINLIVTDPIIAMKAANVLLVLLFAWSCYWFIYSITKRKEAAFLAFALAIFSPELTYFVAQWPKNLLGVIILINLMSALKNKQRFLILLFIIAGFFGHRMTAILNVLVVISWYLYQRVSIKYLVGTAVILIVCVLGLQLFPGLLNINDLERLSGLLGNSFNVAPYKLIMTLGPERVNWWWRAELIVLAITVVLLLIKTGFNFLTDTQQPTLFVFAVLLVLLWFPLYQVDLTGAPYRFYHVGALLLPLILCQVIDFGKWNWGIMVLLVIASFFSYSSYNPKLQDPPYARYDQISAKVKSNLTENPELIIAHKGLADYLDYKLSIDAMSWVPEYEIEESKLLRVAYLQFPQLFEYYTKSTAKQLSTYYFLVQENEWQLYLKELETNEDEDLYLEHTDWRNPNKIRPKYLTENKKH